MNDDHAKNNDARRQGLRDARVKLDLTRDAMAIELGYVGNPNSNKTTMERFEDGTKPVPLPTAKLAWMLEKFGLPDWPAHLEAQPADTRPER